MIFGYKYRGAESDIYYNFLNKGNCSQSEGK